MYSSRLVVSTALALLLLGCSERTEVGALQQSVKQLSGQMKLLQDSLQSMRRMNQMDALLRDLDKVAYLTPGSDGYSVIRTNLGPMTVSLEDIEPYANGSRITLKFGNITSATIDGTKATVEWGSVDANGMAQNETARSRDVVFNESLRSGAWTNVHVVLEGVLPTALGFVRVRDVTYSGIRLLR